MSCRVLLIAALLTAGVCGYCEAEVIATESGMAVREPSVPAPVRGMTMQEVASKFGDPASKSAAVGKPPITRWEYPGFVVFFEYDHVVHTVATSQPVAG